MRNINGNPLFIIGSRQEQIIMAKLRMRCSNLNGHLYTIKIIDSPACSCGFVNENEFHFLLVCPVYNRPRATLQNAIGHIAPFTLRTLLHGDDNLDFTENKRIITEKKMWKKHSDLSMIPKDLRDCLASVMLVFWLCVFTIHCKYSISHLLIDVHLYKLFTCLDINKICLTHLSYLYLCQFLRIGYVSVTFEPLMSRTWGV